MEKKTQNTTANKVNMAQLAKALNQNMGMEKPKKTNKSGKK